MKLEIHVADGDAADIVQANIKDIAGVGYGLYKHLRGVQEEEERVLKAAILDALQKSNISNGDRVTMEFVVGSLEFSQPLIGFSNSILTHAVVDHG